MNFYKVLTFGFCFWCLGPLSVFAATLSMSPATGVYQSGVTFSVNVTVNTSGKAINAADGTLSFNSRELSVVSVSRGASIFNLWTSEPAFSNSAGTVSFSGGSPSGFTGGAGNVMTVTFRALASGAPKVSITGGSVLAADGRGTNVLTSMNGGTYTISAVASQPAAETIVEYVAPANTPNAPSVKSSTHSDFSLWHKANTAQLSWNVPAGVVAVRTLLDGNAISVPSKVYEPPINTITLSDLDAGISYFHIQFKNADGWGKVAHARLAIDNTAPAEFKLTLPPDTDLTSPNQFLHTTFNDSDTSAPIIEYKIQLDGAEPFSIVPDGDNKGIDLIDLKPGYHTVVVEAIDAAGNSSISTLSFTILAFDKPVFTIYPSELTEGVIPVIKGTTRSNAIVEITIGRGSQEPAVYEVSSNETGTFTFIPDNAFTSGVYTLTAVAVDGRGARSDTSDSIRIAVQQPGYIAIGAFIVNILSVFVSLFALIVLASLSVWYTIGRFRKLRGRVASEALEATAVLEQEFTILEKTLSEEALALAATRKGDTLTKGEQHLVDHMQNVIKTARVRVQKEVSDVSELVSKNKQK